MKKLVAPAIAGALIGTLFSVVILSLTAPPGDLAEAIYDWANPVLEAEAEVVGKSAAEWQMVMRSRKYRDCRLLEVQAFDVALGGAVTRLQFRRQDGEQPKGMPVGNFRSATYLIIPPPEHRLQLSFLHECHGRTVRTPVRLKDAS